MGDPISDMFDINPPDQAVSVPLDPATKGLMESQRQRAVASTPESEAAKLSTSGSGLMQDQASINRNLAGLGVRDTGAMSQALQNKAQNVYGNYQSNQNARNVAEGAGKSFHQQSKNFENQHIVQALATQAWQRQVQHETDVLNTRYAVIGSIIGGGMQAFGAYQGRQNANLRAPAVSASTASDFSSDGNTSPYAGTSSEYAMRNQGMGGDTRSFEGSDRQYPTEY